MNQPPSNTNFYTITISEISSSALDELSELVFEHGASGTEEALTFTQANLEYEPQTCELETTKLKVYFEVEPPQKLIEMIKMNWPETHVFFETETNKDWLAEWKKNFKPFCLDRDVWVVPSWCEAPAEAKYVIKIDPGMAFGTGTHETTTLASRFISAYRNLSGSLFDVGTGTGILAILAAKLGFHHIQANDIDPEARRVARENIELNDLQSIIIRDEDLSEINDKFDWVVANIIDGVLVRLQESLKAATNPGGYLLLTGILKEREEFFLTEFKMSGFSIVERKQLNEWVGYLLKKESH